MFRFVLVSLKNKTLISPLLPHSIIVNFHFIIYINFIS